MSGLKTSSARVKSVKKNGLIVIFCWSGGVDVIFVRDFKRKKVKNELL